MVISYKWGRTTGKACVNPMAFGYVHVIVESPDGSECYDFFYPVGKELNNLLIQWQGVPYWEVPEEANSRAAFLMPQAAVKLIRRFYTGK